MKRMLFGILFLATTQTVSGNSMTDTLFNRLKDAIAAAPVYDAHKTTVIQGLKDSLVSRPNLSLSAKFDIIRRLYDEYKTFNYDSAFLFARELQHISCQMRDHSHIVDSKIRLSFILVSAGLFKDAFDSLHAIDVQQVPDSMKASYYSLMGRSYYDLADFDNDKYL